MKIKQLTQPMSPSRMKTDLLTLLFTTVFHRKAAHFRDVHCFTSNYKAISCIFYLFLSKNLHYLSICYRIKSQYLCLMFNAFSNLNSTYLSLFIFHYPPSWVLVKAKQIPSLVKRLAHSGLAAFGNTTGVPPNLLHLAKSYLSPGTSWRPSSKMSAA